MSSRRSAEQVVVESPSIGEGIVVRFAYPQTESSARGPSARIERAKRAILDAVAAVIGDIGSLPPARDRAERRAQQRDRARLRTAMTGFTVERPLNIYIAAEPSPGELRSGQVAALTDRIYVDLADVGNPTRLQAAIRMPLAMVAGGMLGTAQVQPASAATLQHTVIHEAIHALLIRQAMDAEAIWNRASPALHRTGDATAIARFEELCRDYLVSFEELFAFDQEAALYPPVSEDRARYERFIHTAEMFFTRHGITFPERSPRVPGADRAWTFTHRVPTGTIALASTDVESLSLILSSFPVR